MSLGPLHVLLGDVSVQVLFSLFHWIVCLPGMESCEFFIYFWDQNLVRGITGKYICPYSWLPSHFADVFFSHAEAFYFYEVPFVYSSLYVPCCGDILVKILLRGISEIFLPMFSCKTFKDVTFFFLTFYIFIFREGKGRRKRGRKISLCGFLSRTPYWGPGPQPRHVPWLEIELVTLWFAACTHSTEQHQPGFTSYVWVFYPSWVYFGVAVWHKLGV